MLDRELVEAVKLAREAGAILLEIYATDFDVELKGEADPVTEADKRANELLVRRLREAFPNDGVVAEESPDKSDALARGRCWYVDPLDGTKEFVAKNGEFSVMIGLAIDGEAKLGVVYRPVGDRLYRGVVGDSAFVDIEDRTYALGVTDVSEPGELRLVVSRSHRSDATDDFVKRVGIEHEMKSGSVGLKVGLIAQRDADLYVHLSGHASAWDACAPEAILRAAGGVFTDLGGASYLYGGEDLKLSKGILACNNEDTFDRIIDAVRGVAQDHDILAADDVEDTSDDGGDDDGGDDTGDDAEDEAEAG